MHRAGFGEPPCRHDAGGLLPHRFTLTGRHLRRRAGRRSALCSTFRRLSPPGVSPAPLPFGVRTFLGPPCGPRPPGLRAQCSPRQRNHRSGATVQDAPMPRSRLLPALVPLSRRSALAACGGTGSGRRARGATARSWGAAGRDGRPPPETSGFVETGGGESATTSTEPERPPSSEPKPPPIVLVTDAGRQEAVQGSYCVTQVSESGEEQGACADAVIRASDPAERRRPRRAP